MLQGNRYINTISKNYGITLKLVKPKKTDNILISETTLGLNVKLKNICFV